jgi:hypothetical protein
VIDRTPLRVLTRRFIVLRLAEHPSKGESLIRTTTITARPITH